MDEDFKPIPEEFHGMPTERDVCAVENCRAPCEWGRLFCISHIAQMRGESERARKAAWLAKQGGN